MVWCNCKYSNFHCCMCMQLIPIHKSLNCIQHILIREQKRASLYLHLRFMCAAKVDLCAVEGFIQKLESTHNTLCSASPAAIMNPNLMYSGSYSPLQEWKLLTAQGCFTLCLRGTSIFFSFFHLGQW